MAKARDGRLRPTGRQAGAMTEMDHGEMRNQLPLLSYFRRLEAWVRYREERREDWHSSQSEGSREGLAGGVILESTVTVATLPV